MYLKFVSILVSFLLIESVKNDALSDLNYRLKSVELKYDSLQKDIYDVNAVVNEVHNELAQLRGHFESRIQSKCDSGWDSYSDTKCFKVVAEKGTESEAKAFCSQLDSTSTLITIHSKAENDFISNQLKNYKNISDNVWIGLEYVSDEYKWLDELDHKYENWGETAVKDGSSKCVRVSLEDHDLGQWTDDNCMRRYLIVCQKRQSTGTEPDFRQNFKTISKAIETQQKVIEKLNNDLNAKTTGLELQVSNSISESIPSGFIYTQLPYQASPHELWPKLKWTELTGQYAGLFFRAEGGGSQPFGQTQQANYSYISNVNSVGYVVDRGHQGSPTSVIVNKKGWTELHAFGVQDYINIFQTSGSDTRPKNTAVKIWKRMN